jgi:hypothetical protein
MDQELVQYYINLLIIQYQNQPKARATIEAVISMLMLYDLMISVRDGYDLDTAVGRQLDIIGKYLGEDRTITGTTFTREYFGFSEYGDVSPFDFNPYIVYGATPPDVQYRRYEESSQSLYDLNDDEYRQILRFKLVQNYSDASNQDIDDFLDAYFGSSVIFTDRENMTISYIFQDTVERLVTIAQSEGLLPRPAGVGLSVSFVPDINNIYSFSSYGMDAPDFGVGFSEYGVTPVGSWLEYG